MSKPMGKVLHLLKPKTKIVIQHKTGHRYKVLVDNNLSGEGVWAINYRYLDCKTKKYSQPMTGGYFPSYHYTVLRINGRFI